MPFAGLIESKKFRKLETKFDKVIFPDMEKKGRLKDKWGVAPPEDLERQLQDILVAITIAETKIAISSWGRT